MKIDANNFVRSIAEQVPRSVSKASVSPAGETKENVVRLTAVPGQEVTIAKQQNVTEQQSNKRVESVTEQQVRLNQEELNDTIDRLNESAQNIQRSLEFSIDDDLGKTIITVRDKSTDEVVRQIPADEILAISKRIREFSQESSPNTGVLFEEQA